MPDDEDGSMSNWFKKYPRYPNKIIGFSCVTLSVIGLVTASVDWWDPSFVTAGFGVVGIILGLWVAWADR
jgi:hypothetical protein